MMKAVYEPVASPVAVSIEELIALGQRTASHIWPPTMIRAQHGGQYLSRMKGRGMEFDEVRLYQPGDDVRSIDWRVTARTGKPHTKLFREERERPVVISVDNRRAMHFATRGVFKSVFAARMAALLAWTALNHGDRVGGMIYTDQGHHEFRPARSRSRVLQFLKPLCGEYHSAGLQQNPGDTLTGLLRLRRMVTPGSLCILISDFRDWSEEIAAQISQLSRHNQLMLIVISDPLDAQLPPAGLYRLSDGRREQLLDNRNRSRVMQYQQDYRDWVQAMRQFCLTRSVSLLMAKTTDNPESLLRHPHAAYSADTESLAGERA